MGLRIFCLVTMIYCYHGWAQEQELQENAVSSQKFERSFQDYNVWYDHNGCLHIVCVRDSPVCGSDGRNYINQCHLENRARCVDSSLTLKHYGRCEASKGHNDFTRPNLKLAIDHIKTGRSLVSDTPCNWPSGEQYWPHPTNCLMYVQCSPSGPVERDCPAGTAWSQSLPGCDHLHNTDCDPSKPQRPDDKECEDSEPATYIGCNRCWCQGGRHVCTQRACAPAQKGSCNYWCKRPLGESYCCEQAKRDIEQVDKPTKE